MILTGSEFFWMKSCLGQWGQRVVSAVQSVNSQLHVAGLAEVSITVTSEG